MNNLALLNERELVRLAHNPLSLPPHHSLHQALHSLPLYLTESIHATMNIFRGWGKFEAHVNTVDTLNSKWENVDGSNRQVLS